MKALSVLTLSASLLVFFVTAATSQENQMDQKKHKQMMEMMKDSTMVSMMMEHMAKDDHLRSMMMSKMMEACKSDTSKMMDMCKMMMEDKDMHSTMMKMMQSGNMGQMSDSMGKSQQESEHQQHHQKKESAESAAANEVLIKFKPGTKEAQIKSMASEVGMQQVKFIKELNLGVFKITSGKSVDEVIEHCQKEPFVDYAEPNLKYKTMK